MEGENSHGVPVSDSSQRARSAATSRLQVSNLSVLYFNARSIVPKHDELCAVVEANNPDIICIVESWLCSDILDSEVDLPGYDVHRLDRNRHGGGILVYVRSNFVSKVYPFPGNLELLTLSVCNGNDKVCISLFYRPPNSSCEVFENLFLYLQSLDTSRFSNYILLGDFNVNFCNIGHPYYRNLCNIFSSFGLTQIVSEPTRICSSGNNSMLDLVAMSSPFLLQSCETIPPLCNSDHLGLLLRTRWRSSQQSSNSNSEHSSRKIWRYAHADITKARQLVSDTNWDPIMSDDIDQSWFLWQQKFLSIMEDSIPSKILPPRRNNLPWINKRIVQSIRRRNNLFKKAKNSQDDEAKYRRARNKVVTLMRLAKKAYFRKLNPHQTKQFWKSVKVLNRKSSSIPSLHHGPSLLSTNQEKADTLNSFFSQCYNYSVPPLLPADRGPVNSCPEDLLCTIEEVTELLKSLDTTKATGPDGISSKMLKMTADEIAPSVTALFNLSICCNRPPSEWKRSNVVPIPKKKTNSPTPADFRPISLLPVLSKLLEKHFHLLISDHLSESCPISSVQWGFQRGKSTVNALLETTNTWLQHMETGREVGAVFFDFKKAFDSVPHIPLITKLQQLNLDPNIVSWVKNYLTDRTQCVVVNGAASAHLPVVSGVPQGSVLGPLLFLIYINDITALDLTEGSTLVLYADDILLYRPITSTTDWSALQRDVSSIQTWATTNFLQFNESKCKMMHVSRKRAPISPSIPIALNGSVLEEVETFKYLGLLISSDMSWSKHIENICSKARKVLGLLYRRYYRFADQNTLLQLYTSLVRPHLEYAAPVWDPHLQRNIQLLERTQKFASRLCAKAWDRSYDELLETLNLPTLSDRRLFLKLCTVFKVVHNLCYFPPDILSARETRTCSSRQLLLSQPFARTNSYLHSFVPSAVRHWNHLPPSVVAKHSFCSFKSVLSHHLFDST